MQQQNDARRLTPAWVRARQPLRSHAAPVTCAECPRKGQALKAVDVAAEQAACARVAQMIADRAAGYAQPLAQLDPLAWELSRLWLYRVALNERACLGEAAEQSARLANLLRGLKPAAE